MLPEKQDRAFADSFKSARFNKILDQKTTQLIHLASATSGSRTCSTVRRVGLRP